MRLLHLSDLHIYKNWIEELKNDDFYFEAFIKDIVKKNDEREFDLIVVTGDLVDQGGRSFDGDDYYKTIDRQVFDSIAQALTIEKNKIIFIPGNHDIDRTKINETYEDGLLKKKSFKEINKVITSVKNGKPGDYDNEAVRRLEIYKKFESGYYPPSSDLYLSKFETCFKFKFGETTIGIIGLNSAWRCSSSLPADKLFLGPVQIANAKSFLHGSTDFNIALIHHPIEMFSDAEQQEIKTSLSRSNIHLVLSGHRHAPNNHKATDTVGEVVFAVGRSVFNQSEETDETVSKFEPGYSIIDFSRTENTVIVRFNCRKYEPNRKEFDGDTRAGAGGIYEYSIKADPGRKNLSYFPFESQENKPIADLTKEWTQKTLLLIGSAFPRLSKKIVKRVKDNMLPEKLNYFHKDLKLAYTITKFDDEHFCLREIQSFTIVSNGTPVPLDVQFYVEKQNITSDKSDIEVEEFYIDEMDHKFDIEKKTRYNEQGASIIIEISLFKILQGKKEYAVRRVLNSIHSTKLNGYWRYDVGVIIENAFLSVKNVDKYELDIVEFGNNINLIPNMTSQIFKNDRKFDLLMPGQGFFLLIK